MNIFYLFNLKLFLKGFSRVTPFETYVDFCEGVNGILIDIRPSDQFEMFHLIGSHNFPFDKFSADEISDVCNLGQIIFIFQVPKDRVIYILAPDHQIIEQAPKVAQGFQSQGVFKVNIIESDLESMRNIGFMYWMDVPAEMARREAIKAAEAKK